MSKDIRIFLTDDGNIVGGASLPLDPGEKPPVDRMTPLRVRTRIAPSPASMMAPVTRPFSETRSSSAAPNRIGTPFIRRL